MSSIEDRLRDAYQEAAAAVRPASLRGVPLLEPAPGPARRRRAPRQPGPRWRLLAPVAAAAAVTAIAVTAVALPRLLPSHHGGGATSAGPAHPARFFMASGNYDDLIVYSAVTGRETADLKPISPRTSMSISAATGNDQVFIVAATSTNACGSSQLLSLTLSPTGKAEIIGSLRVPKIAGEITALASSASGKTIAYASGPCGHGAQSPGQIGIVHTDGRPARHWGWNPDPGQVVSSLSITADGKTIEYAASPNKIIDQSLPTTMPVRQIRLLPADAPPGTAAERSRVAVTIRTAAPGWQFTSGLIAAGGQAVYFCTEAGASAGHPAETLRAYDVATGTTAVLHHFGPTGRQGCLLGSSAGELLVVRDVTRTPSLVDRLNLSTGRLTQVPVRVSVDEHTSSVPW